MHVSIVLCLSLVHYGNLHPLYGYPRGTVGENYAYLTFCMSRPPSNSIPTLGLHNRNTIIVDFQMRPPFLCVNVRWVTFLCAERKVVFPMINTNSRALDIKLPKCFKVINNRLCKIFALVIKTCAILRKNRRVFCRAARQTSWTAQWADNAISAFQRENGGGKGSPSIRPHGRPVSQTFMKQHYALSNWTNIVKTSKKTCSRGFKLSHHACTDIHIPVRNPMLNVSRQNL